MVEATTPMGPMKVTMKGKVEGDDLTGEATTPLALLMSPSKGYDVSNWKVL